MLAVGADARYTAEALLAAAGAFAAVTGTLWMLGLPCAPPSHVAWLRRQRDRLTAARRRHGPRLPPRAAPPRDDPGHDTPR